jgi:hypothetical protein
MHVQKLSPLFQDPGSTKSRTKRQIQLVLVEKGTGFILWSDVIDNLSKYTRQGGPFHTMHLSADHSSRCRGNLNICNIQ